MGRTIQMVFTGEGYLWIIGFNPETMELTFRTSRNPQHLQTEKVLVKDGNIYTNLYFHPNYLEKFLAENNNVLKKYLSLE